MYGWAVYECFGWYCVSVSESLCVVRIQISVLPAERSEISVHHYVVKVTAFVCLSLVLTHFALTRDMPQ